MRGRLKRRLALEGDEGPVADGKSVVPVHGGFVDGPGWSRHASHRAKVLHGEEISEIPTQTFQSTVKA
jgi:hypothetical protein